MENNKTAQIKGFGTPEIIEIVKTKISTPNENEVLVKIGASTISTTDSIIRKGLYPPLKAKPPFVLGYDYVGKIVKVGTKVSSFKIGEIVGGLSIIGGSAEYICLDAKAVFKIKSEEDLTKLAFLPLYGITAYQMLHNFKNLKKNDKVLIHGGSGSVGNLLLQIGKSKGLDMVATGSVENQGAITKYGAKAVDYKSADYTEKLSQIAEDGLDMVFDFTNHKSFNKTFGLLKKDGILLTSGIFTKASQIEKKTFGKFLGFGLSFGKMLLKLAIWNALPNKKSAHFYDIKALKEKKPKQYQEDLNSLVNLLEEGKIVPEIYRTYDVAEIQSAHQDLENSNVVGSLVLLNSD